MRDGNTPKACGLQTDVRTLIQSKQSMGLDYCTEKSTLQNQRETDGQQQ